MPEEFYAQHFPNLKDRFRRTSEPAYYNCIAYVVGDKRRKWWPGDYHPSWSHDFWPSCTVPGETLQAFTMALAMARYEICPDGSPEEGIEKVALYGFSEHSITHAALQQEDGTWTSKLGEDEDIQHPLDGLEGPFYGKVIAFLKRVRLSTEEQNAKNPLPPPNQTEKSMSD